jgi:peroxiredoxin (alkyl hydroperoxide reductase subunit C)
MEVDMAELKDSCVKPVRGPIMPAAFPQSASAISAQEVQKVTARVGQDAPDFELSAFVAGKGFQPIKLSDYKGKWIVLCFYPGDFTFV